MAEQEQRQSVASKLPSAGLSKRFMIAVLVFLAALKLVASFTMLPLGDEAYYWLWGQNIALSYFDHPGLASWLLGATDAIFGTSLFGLRIASVLTGVGSVWFLWLYAGRILPAQRQKVFLFITLMVATSPTLFVWSTLVYHDHLLIFLSLAAMFFFTSYLGDEAKDRTGRLNQLYVGAVFLGLAGLTKYSAVFMGLAIAILVIAHPKLRHLLLRVHIYLAGFITAVMQTPTLIWNFNRDFASFGFHFKDRYGSQWLLEFNPDSFFNFVLVTLLLFGPFLIPPFIRLFRAKTSPDFLGIGIWIARLVTVMSTSTFMFIAFFSFTLWYWSDLSYLLMLVMLPVLAMRKWLALAHIWFGILVITLVCFNYTVVPIASLLGQRDIEAGTVYGWDEIANFVAEAEKVQQPTFIAATRFQSASQLSFAMQRTNISAIEVRPSQFDIWEDRDTNAGGTGLILQDEFGDLGETKRRFESVEKIDEFTVQRFGYPLLKYELYLGTNYKPRATNLVTD
ncbi:ArnT family glycosyltransferase [Maritalea sp.]|jgi:4-amino-4-deoxy-L-arabinose transferase-like glycosyltransferase|uniref:ArnT family glycosyltransferase n=1 Tax=Maritalea sp. TaxID=2003361 RepID=UPI0039E63EEA